MLQGEGGRLRGPKRLSVSCGAEVVLERRERVLQTVVL